VPPPAPEAPPPRRAAAELAAVALVGAWNLVGNLWLPAWAYVPANLACAAALLALARKAGASWDDLGLRPSAVGAGLRLGLAAAAAVALALAAGAALPATRSLLRDDRVAQVGAAVAAYHLLLRIPVGTAVFEEVAFRGVLLGLARRRLPPLAAATASSALFGLWHVLPTLARVRHLGVGGSATLGLLLTGGVLVTWLAGYLLCWLRLRAGSLVAPVLAHAALNSLAYLAALLVAAA
jgi:uncharacterized protein